MPELNVNVPTTYCSVRAEYLYNLKRRKGRFIPCAIFGVSSIQARAIGFHCLLENGAVIYRLPLSAFVHKTSAPNLPLDHLELWDCLSRDVVCTEYEMLRGLRVTVVLKDRKKYNGVCLYTLDWHNSSWSDNPGEGGHKCAHIIALDNGCYAAQPNNRIQWHEPSFVTVPFPERPDYETNDHVWSVENKGQKWHTENSQRMFYDLEVIEPHADTNRETGIVQGLPTVRESRRDRVGRGADGRKDDVRGGGTRRGRRRSS